MNKTTEQLLKLAFILSLITIIYNLFEGGISVYFGMSDDSLSLFGFGVDSFVEVISGVGIAHMIIRMKNNLNVSKDNFEKRALIITGISFFLLTAGLILGAVINVFQNVEPETTLPGVIISVISILTMYFLMNSKLKVGKELNSEAIIADAKCTKTCLRLSIILLCASLLYQLFHLLYIDVIGSLVIAYISFSEGKEAIEKSKRSNFKCCDDD